MCSFTTDPLDAEGLYLLRYEANLKPCGDANVCRHNLRALLRERDDAVEALRAIAALPDASHRAVGDYADIARAALARLEGK